jgi:hypothetical protein
MLTLIIMSLPIILLLALALVYHVLEVAQSGELLLIKLLLDHCVELGVLLEDLPDAAGAHVSVHLLDFPRIALPLDHKFVHLIVRGLVQVEAEFLLHIEVS